MSEIILSGITFEQLQESFKSIVRNEVQLIVSGLQPAAEPAPELITRKVTAEILAISLPTLNEWTKTGIIYKYQTKPQLALKLVKQAIDAVIAFDFIAGDGLYGHNAELTRALDSLNRRSQR